MALYLSAAVAPASDDLSELVHDRLPSGYGNLYDPRYLFRAEVDHGRSAISGCADVKLRPVIGEQQPH